MCCLFQKKINKKKESAKEGGDNTTPCTKEGERGVLAGGVFVSRGGDSRRRCVRASALEFSDKNKRL